MMMVCNVAVIVDGCLVDLNTDSEVVTTSTFSVTSVDVVVLSFGQVVPVRVRRSLSEEIPTISPGTSVNNLCCVKRVTRVQAHIELTRVITIHVESVASSGWRNEPTLYFIAKVVALVGRHLKLSQKCLCMVVVSPVGPVNRTCLIIELSIQTM